MSKETRALKFERWLIIVIAMHSIGIGVGLLVCPGWAFELCGFDNVRQTFFPHQGGVFHIVLAIGYLIEYLRYRGVILLLTAKIIAAVFLFITAMAGEQAIVIPLFGAVDALMAIVVFFVHRHARSS